MRVTQASAVLVGLLVLVQLNWSSPSWAWTLEGHRLIALDALGVLPPPMREALAPHVSVILAGLVEPDFHRVVSHKIQLLRLTITCRRCLWAIGEDADADLVGIARLNQPRLTI